MRARKTLASVLMFVFAASVLTDSVFASPAANGSDFGRLRRQVAHLRAGALIEVRFLNRENVRGRLGAVDPDGFALKLHASASERHVAFAEVKSVKAIQSKGSRVATWIVAGVLVLAVVAAIGVYLTFRHSKGL
jgi:hypothetical protein